MAEFSKMMEEAKQQVLMADPRNLTDKPIIYVFCSLAGGTGSGMLLDACFYLRENFPEPVMVGFIGVLEGVTTMSTSAIRKLQGR